MDLRFKPIVPPEHHAIHHIAWLRAAVLGANDGILSTAGIISGMAAGGAPGNAIFLAGLAGTVAGAASMATGEYVSVSSQADIERMDLRREQRELAINKSYEAEELAQIYVRRGLEVTLAREVARQLMAHDALGAHARDELGISEIAVARPLNAALSSAASFTAGALLPLAAVKLAPPQWMPGTVLTVSICALAVLGAASARTGSVPIIRPVVRVIGWGVLTMVLTAFISHFYGLD